MEFPYRKLRYVCSEVHNCSKPFGPRSEVLFELSFTEANVNKN